MAVSLVSERKDFHYQARESVPLRVEKWRTVFKGARPSQLVAQVQGCNQVSGASVAPSFLPLLNKTPKELISDEPDEELQNSLKIPVTVRRPKLWPESKAQAESGHHWRSPIESWR